MPDNGSTQWGPWTINDIAFRLLGGDKYDQWYGAVTRISRKIQDETDPHERYRELRFHSARVIEIEFLGGLITKNYIVTSIRDGVVTPVPLLQIPIPSIHISLFTDLIVAASATSIEEWPFVSIYPPTLALSQSNWLVDDGLTSEHAALEAGTTVPQSAHLQAQFDEELRKRKRDGKRRNNGFKDEMLQFARGLGVNSNMAKNLWRNSPKELRRVGRQENQVSLKYLI